MVEITRRHLSEKMKGIYGWNGNGIVKTKQTLVAHANNVILLQQQDDFVKEF